MADPKQSYDITKLFMPIVVLSVGGLFGWVIKTEATRYTAKDAHHERHEIQKETHNLLREAHDDIMHHHNELSERIARLEAFHMTPAKENHPQTK